VHGVGSGETGTWLESTLRSAKGAAERVYGSAKMENELEVRVRNESKEEAALLGAVLQAPMLDNLVPSTIDATVEDGGVTLADSPTGSSTATKPSSRSTAASWSSADRQDTAARGDAGRAAAYPREEQRDGLRAIP
jgi:hypothetical protein